MAYPIRVSEGLVFSPVAKVKKHWQKWHDPINGEPKGHFEKSDTRKDGLKEIHTLKLADGQELELSRDQVSQFLMLAFDENKDWREMKFVAKSNGKEKLEKRWFVNLAKDGQTSQLADQLNVQSPVEIEVGGETINF